MKAGKRRWRRLPRRLGVLDAGDLDDLAVLDMQQLLAAEHQMMALQVIAIQNSQVIELLASRP